MSAVPVARPWRRFLRFSVRGLIVLVLVIGVWLGWLVRSARIQREAVAAIKKAGGSVKYDWEPCSGTVNPEGKPWGPAWLVDLIGVDYFGHVIKVRVYSPWNATDATLAQVGRLTRLHGLHIPQASVSDLGLAHLNGLTKLKSLALSDTRITDAGLEHLKGLTDLSAIALNGTPITGAGLAHLHGLRNLYFIGLSGTRMTDSGLPHLKGLTNLKFLDLCDTEVTDSGIKELQQALPSLKITH